MSSKNQPIGIFDSGVGGLTVAKAIIAELPNESLIYLGDTARIPYGTRSPEVVTKFALELTRFLLAKKVKCLIVACNTISANALGKIKQISPVPVLDVISPTLEVARKSPGPIGVIATTSTINSGAYATVVRFSQACPLFVPLAEEGITKGSAVENIARGYLLGLKEAGIKTLILGCTHYPLLYTVIAKTIGSGVKLVTSGGPTVKKLRQFLAQKGLLAQNSKPRFEFYFTDDPMRVITVAENFFGRKLPGKVAKIEL